MPKIPTLIHPTLPPPKPIVNRKYKKGKIYIIKSPNYPKSYIGSTCLNLDFRFSFHKEAKNTTSKVIIDAGDAYIKLLENYPCNCKQDLLRREGEYIKKYKDTLVNYNVAGRTKYEYHSEVFAEYNKLRCKDYYNSTKEKVTCECGKTVFNKGLKAHELTNYHIEHSPKKEI